MFSFFRFRRNPQIFEETPRQKMMRFFLLLCIFSGVLWGLARNMERISTSLGYSSSGVSNPAFFRADATGTLTQEQEIALQTFCVAFQHHFGLALIVRAQAAPFSQQQAVTLARASSLDQPPQSLFLGICPPQHQVVLLVPPLARPLLGESFIQSLRDDHFIPYFAAGNWPEGLAAALNLLNRRLDAATHPAADTLQRPFVFPTQLQ